MPWYFFDSSALAKRYCAEVGTECVDRLLSGTDCRAVVSRLSVVEFHSALARRVREKLITLADFDQLSLRFLADVQQQVFRVARVGTEGFEAATLLVRKYGPTTKLRTLDALQLRCVSEAWTASILL